MRLYIVSCRAVSRSRAMVWIQVLVYVLGVLLLSARHCVALSDSDGLSFGKGWVGVGLNYPGVGLRYFFLDRCLVEARGQYDPEVVALGLRGARYIAPRGELLPYFGVEGDYLVFEGELTRGRGYFIEAFAGIETFLHADRISFQFDFGPSYVWLRDRGFDVSVSGVEYVVNFGFIYYLYSGRGL